MTMPGYGDHLPPVEPDNTSATNAAYDFLQNRLKECVDRCKAEISAYLSSSPNIGVLPQPEEIEEAAYDLVKELVYEHIEASCAVLREHGHDDWNAVYEPEFIAKRRKENKQAWKPASELLFEALRPVPYNPATALSLEAINRQIGVACGNGACQTVTHPEEAA